VLTFEPHPADFFAKRPVVFRLSPKAIKARALEPLGLDGVVFLTFDAALASLTAEAFVADVLVGRLGVAAVVIGWDFHFGRGRLGSPAFLREAGERYGFRVDIIDKVEGAGAEAISSTAIRRALEAGDVEAAARLLGRDYAVEGVVIEGAKLGRTLGVPTANIGLEAANRLAHGVYAVEVLIDGARYGGVASFGTRPTVDADGAPLLETHLFDFSGVLYGRTIEVAFVKRIRDELKFDGLDALVAEMERDKARARTILAARRG
jgi:riboflavin kinase/FMN adenylyltransferase